MKKYTFSNDGPFFMRIWSGGWGGFALQVFISLPGRGHSPAVGGRLSLGGYAA